MNLFTLNVALLRQIIGIMKFTGFVVFRSLHKTDLCFTNKTVVELENVNSIGAFSLIHPI